MPIRLPKWFDGTTLNIWLSCGLIVGGVTLYEMKTGKIKGKPLDRWSVVKSNVQENKPEDDDEDDDVNFDEIDELKKN